VVDASATAARLLPDGASEVADNAYAALARAASANAVMALTLEDLA
jgi:hypothetical protein